jgi:hypothetical protein
LTAGGGQCRSLVPHGLLAQLRFLRLPLCRELLARFLAFVCLHFVYFGLRRLFARLSLACFTRLLAFGTLSGLF